MIRKTAIVGRSSHADIVIADEGVDAFHSELVITSSGRLYLTDRASRSGTYLKTVDGWTAVRQTFITDRDLLRFGKSQCSGQELRQRADLAVGKSGSPENSSIGRSAPQLRGAVERDPSTGEIVRRKY